MRMTITEALKHLDYAEKLARDDTLSDRFTRLPNGYSIVRSSPGAVALVRPSSEEVISPPIDGYRIHSRLIIGHSRRWDAPGKPGYFVVDTRTGERWHRLTKNQWMTVLRDHGIRSAPPLIEPRPYSGLRARF
jgi:hypothetical protein